MPAFKYTHRLIYADCTIGDHVYYGRYLQLLEAARGEFFRHIGSSFTQWQEKGVIFPVIECRLRYRAPARYDDMLSIELLVAAAEGARLDFDYRVLNQIGSLVVEAQTRHACTGLDGRPRRLPPELRESLATFVQPGCASR